MPIRVERDQRKRRLLATATGVLTIEEVLHFIRTARANPEIETWPLLFDARGATTTIAPDEIDQAVALVAEIRRTSVVPRGHVAIVADDEQVFQRFLLHETRTAELGAKMVRVFRHLEQAERWLEIMHAARYF